LHRAVTRAIRAAKRVRTETTIGTGQVSVPSVAVDLAKQIFGELAGRTVLLVGSGEMAETVARLLQNAGCRLLVTGRNDARVASLARSVGAEGRSWDELGAALVEADVVVSSTSAPHFVITHSAVKATRKARRGRTLFFIDLAVPRDVDPHVERLDGVFLYNVDDFSHIVAESISARHKEAERANRIVHEEAAGYERWADSIQVTPTIVALRERFQRVVQGELERSLRSRLKHLSAEDRAALGKMLEAVVNKLLHEPTTRLRQAAVDGALDERAFEVLVDLFGIDQKDAAEGIVRNLTAVPVLAEVEEDVIDSRISHATSHESALGTTRR
jgi:glutamyl-tRNA reductase